MLYMMAGCGPRSRASETVRPLRTRAAACARLAGVGAAARAAGARVLWASEGRGTDTWARAATAELDDAGTLRDVVAASDAILSVCPPHAARDVATAVAAAGFRKLYVDANAVAPA